MSRIPPALARRIDRLARRAHAFHRWAHHPLCSRYAPELVSLGRRARACLGCSLAAAGGLAGIALGSAVAALPPALLVATGACLLVGVPAVISARAPVGPEAGAHAAPWSGERGRGPRAHKLVTRFLPVALTGAVVAQALRAPSPARLGAASLAGAAVAWAVSRYRRRGPDRSACEGCPEGPPTPRCPGLRPVFRRERAMSRLAWRWIDAVLPAQAPGAATSPPPRPSPVAPPGPATAGPQRSS